MYWMTQGDIVGHRVLHDFGLLTTCVLTADSLEITLFPTLAEGLCLINPLQKFTK
jgi:hypothetical protein